MRRTRGDHAPVVDDRDAVAKLFGLVEVVGREQHRVAVSLHLQNLRVQLAPRLRIESGGRFVEQHQFRGVHKCQRQCEALPLSTRQGIETRVRLFREGKPRQ